MYQFNSSESLDLMKKIADLTLDLTAYIKSPEFKNLPECIHGQKKDFCNQCKNAQKTFEKNARSIYHGKFWYYETKYIDETTPVLIQCKFHYDKPFSVIPKEFLLGNQICLLCENESTQLTNAFLQRARTQLKDRYDNFDYSEVKIISNCYNKVIIRCKRHDNKFKTNLLAYNIIDGCGQCRIDSRRMTTEEYLILAKRTHGNKYDLSLTNYRDSKTQIAYKCHKHGIKFKDPYSFLKGSGCADCLFKGEDSLYNMLLELNLRVERQKIFANLPNARFDFYLPDYSLVIELDGEQHFTQVANWTPPEVTQAKDCVKMDYCQSKGISVLRFLQDEVLKNKFDIRKTLLKRIKKYERPVILMLSTIDKYKVYGKYYTDYQ